MPAFAEWTAPNKLMDGLAAGRPVVTNQPGRAARLVQDGPSGIAVPPADAPALADALQRLAGNRTLREAMGQAARHQAVTRWDRRLLAAQFCAVVEAAASRPSSRPAPAGLSVTSDPSDAAPARVLARPPIQDPVAGRPGGARAGAV